MPDDNKNLELTTAPILNKLRKTGPDRLHRPVYIDQLPPCNHACPAGENIQKWLDSTQAGQFREAWETIVKDNPFPAIHGRVCYHPCEDSCHRHHIDDAISIHAIERFLGDLAIEQDWEIKLSRIPSGKRILIVGAGPSGLSAAYHLFLLGHDVLIYESEPKPGGMMRFGIPKYRLPRNILDAEIQRIINLGVEIIPDRKINDLEREIKNERFDATFIAVGAHLSRQIHIPTCDAARIIDAGRLLEDHEIGIPPKLGKRVAVYGGGNTAMDAARTAKRLGSDETVIVYRRDRDHMPAHDFEADDALEEGIKIHWLRTVKEFDTKGITIEKMVLDEDGTPQPTGKYEHLPADSLIMAVGQNIDNSFLRNVKGLKVNQDGTVIVNDRMMTGCPGLFAGGDMIPAERSVAVAVGHGKKAARNIDAWLRQKSRIQPDNRNVIEFDELNVWYYTDAVRQNQKKLGLDKRKHSFDEIYHGLNTNAVKYEARRCLSCGNCFECDGCYAVCPDDAVVKLGKGKRYRFDYEKCTGCAICVDQCPCGAITMEPESV